ncbi:ExbD/TolR family protein [Roseicyclus sp.]|uniref:ExbD/TolR family protein n=1 Tax=Roseicyclus sp. TaxID=1914329 RepID=UPI003F9F8EA3
MPLRRRQARRARETTIPLINVVLLMLVFFLIAGAIAPPLDGRVELVETSGLAGRAPPDAAVILADGTMTLRGAPVTPAALLAEGPAPRLVPDRGLPATELVALSRELRDLGAEEVWIVTERGLE